MKTAIDDLDENKRYKLECGHNNFGLINLYPFKTVICFECGFKTERIIEDK